MHFCPRGSVGTELNCNNARSISVKLSILLGVAATIFSIEPSIAQTMQPIEINPPLTTSDSNGVDFSSGQVRIPITLLTYSVSPNGSPVTMSIMAPRLPAVPIPDPASMYGPALYESMSYNFYRLLQATRYGQKLIMPGANGNAMSFLSSQSNGSKIYLPILDEGGLAPMGFIPAGTAAELYFASDGTQAYFADPTSQNDIINPATQIAFPDGEKWNLIYNTAAFSFGPWNRLKFVLSSRGYGIQFSYLIDSLSGTNANTERRWRAITKVTYFNRATNYCDTTTATDCAAISTMKSSATIEYSATDGSVIFHTPTYRTGYKMKLGNSLEVQDLAVAGSTKTYTFSSISNGDLGVGQYTDSNGTYTYAFATEIQEGSGCPCSGTTYGSRNDPQGNTIATWADINSAFISAAINEKGLTTGPKYMMGKIVGMDVYGPTGTTYNSINYQADNRGNILKQMSGPPTGAPITLFTRTFASECFNPKTCNKPTSAADANGNTTTYTYSPDHGGVLTETGPAVGGVAPVKRYSYGQRYAWIKNSAGAFVHAGDPIWVLLTEKSCNATATNVATDSCSGGASDEVVTAYDYGPDTGLVGNNLLVRGKAVTASGVTLRTCYGYDDSGNKIWETTPRAGLAACY